MTNKTIRIQGPADLSGIVEISGAKNAALPELAATILTDQRMKFNHVPEVEDVKIMFKALLSIGAEGEFKSNQLTIRLGSLKSSKVPPEITETTRASILILGPLIARSGFAQVSLPGGCPIGERKINFHLEGLRKMGVKITTENGLLLAKADKLKAADYTFPAKSVTGTENLLMAATLAEGTSVFKNCALEPEIDDLITLLVNMGADIKKEDPETIIIRGKTSLSGTCHTVIPDRIEMGTYLIAGALKGKNLLIKNMVTEYITPLIEILKFSDSAITVKGSSLQISSATRIEPVNITTEPYPGFPTDLQAQITTFLTQAEGTSYIEENIFNNRFQHTRELNKMGADISVTGNRAKITGHTDLSGSLIRATDLRASAALILAGLIARGETIIRNSYQLMRGYENMPAKLNALGAQINVWEDEIG